MPIYEKKKLAFRFSPRDNKAKNINWNEWSEKAFNTAKKQDKLILLSISATWCHWCHVMDETTFSHEPVINFINQNFIPVRVDTDMRPDINRRYNMGGWPTVAILNYDGVLLSGGTYIPPEKFLTFLEEIHSYYKNNRDEIEVKIRENKNKAKPIFTLKTISKGLVCDAIKYVYENIVKTYDKLYGGFGIEPKFPMSEALEFLLFYYSKTGDDNASLMLSKTLTNMLEGGIFDQTDGGFFRYSTTRDWSIPHYEKMLEDNSVLLKILLEAYNVIKNDKFKDGASRIISYMKSELYDNKNSVFYGSQDAEVDFYRLPPDKRRKTKKPPVDKTLYTDKNALAAMGFLYSGLVLDDNSYLQMIISLINFFNKIFDDDYGFYHYYAQKPELLGILNDNINMLNALLDLYEITVDENYLDKASKIATIIVNKFFDNNKGGFFEDIVNDKTLKNINKDEKDILTNSRTALALMRLDGILERDDHKKEISKTLKLFSKLYEKYGIYASTYAVAMDFYMNGPLYIDVVGRKDDDKTNSFYKKVLKTYAPNKIVKYIDVVDDASKLDLKGYSPLKYPAAYICIGEKCIDPVVDEEEIEDAIRISSKIFK